MAHGRSVELNAIRPEIKQLMASRGASIVSKAENEAYKAWAVGKKSPASSRDAFRADPEYQARVMRVVDVTMAALGAKKEEK